MKRLLFALLITMVVAGLILPSCAQPAPSPVPSPTGPSPTPTTSTPSPAPPKPTQSPSPTTQPSPTSAKPIELKVATFGSMQSSGVTIVIGPWAKTIEEATGGRVKFTIYAGTLVKQAELADAVETGLADIVMITPDITPGRFPRTEINVLPGLYTDPKAGGPALHRTLEKYAFAQEWNKVKPLFLQPFAPMAIASSKPIQKLEDMKGLKIGAEGTVENWYVEALGGTAVRFSLPEVYGMMERKLIDVINFAWEAIFIFDVKSVSKYHVNAETLNRGFMVAMNLDSWKRLPPDIQAIFEKNIGPERTKIVGIGMDELNKTMKKNVADFDAKVGNPPILEFSPEEAAKWKAVYKKIQDKWVAEKEKAGIPAKAMLEDFYKFLAEYSK